jgi:hypothetical protein
MQIPLDADQVAALDLVNEMARAVSSALKIPRRTCSPILALPVHC